VAQPDPVRHQVRHAPPRRSDPRQTQQTSDNRQIIVEAACFWRVKDPLRFFERFSVAGDRSADHFRKAQEIIESNLRSAIGATSKFAMSDLFNAAGATKLPDLEKAILSAWSSAKPPPAGRRPSRWRTTASRPSTSASPA
jgi:regulator of protease activity HflC (stomatin/prohibitin superfamily)